MGKRNKIRYVASPKQRPELVVSGKVYLLYRDAEYETPEKGDMLVFAECKALHTNHLGEYERTGFSGYFKVDIFDGKDWQPVILNEIFQDKEHHFSRKERSIDTYMLCKEKLASLSGKKLKRTYREHYEYKDEDEGEEKEEKS